MRVSSYIHFLSKNNFYDKNRIKAFSLYIKKQVNKSPEYSQLVSAIKRSSGEFVKVLT